MFNNSAVNYGSVETCVKLFVLHPQRPNIRLSVMVEYCELTLQSCKVYFENSDGKSLISLLMFMFCCSNRLKDLDLQLTLFF